MRVEERVDVRGMTRNRQEETAEGLVGDLADKDATCIVTDQQVFDTAYGVVSAYDAIPDAARALVVDAMCSNLSVLNASAQTLLATNTAETVDADAVKAHASALMAYATLLHHILEQGQRMASAAPADATAAAAELAAGKRAAKAKAKAAAAKSSLSEYDWPALRAKAMRALASATVVDLPRLFSPAPVDDGLLTLLGKCAMLVLEDASAVAGKAQREHRADVWRVFASLALSHAGTQLEPVSESLRDALAKHEHVAPLLAELCEFATFEFSGGASTRLESDLRRFAQHKRPLLDCDCQVSGLVGDVVGHLAVAIKQWTLVLCETPGVRFGR